MDGSRSGRIATVPAPCALRRGVSRVSGPSLESQLDRPARRYERGGTWRTRSGLDKGAAVAELTDNFRNSPATLLTEYRGLTVAQLTQLRRTLGATTTYAVTKNTLAKRAATDAGIEGLDALFTGPTALAFVSGDPVEAAKGLRDFAKTNPLLVIKGGVFEGKAITAGGSRQDRRPGVPRGAAGQAGRCA